VVFQTGPGGGPEDPAFPEGEGLVDEGQGIPHGRGGDVRSKIERTVALQPAGDRGSGKRFPGVDAEEGIMLIVSKDDIILGLLLLDQIAFQDKGFKLALGDDILDIFYLRDHRKEARGEGGGVLEIGRYSFPKRQRLPDVKGPSAGIAKEIDSRRIG